MCAEGYFRPPNADEPPLAGIWVCTRRGPGHAPRGGNRGTGDPATSGMFGGGGAGRGITNTSGSVSATRGQWGECLAAAGAFGLSLGADVLLAVGTAGVATSVVKAYGSGLVARTLALSGNSIGAQTMIGHSQGHLLAGARTATVTAVAQAENFVHPSNYPDIGNTSGFWNYLGRYGPFVGSITRWREAYSACYF